MCLASVLTFVVSWSIFLFSFTSMYGVVYEDQLYYTRFAPGKAVLERPGLNFDMQIPERRRRLWHI